MFGLVGGVDVERGGVGRRKEDRLTFEAEVELNSLPGDVFNSEPRKTRR
jgi:hypothetical protein